MRYLCHFVTLIVVSVVSANRRLTIDDPLEDLPSPHIIILGATGVGKSSLANVFIGEDPNCKNCTFPVCSGPDSCTKDTNYAVKPWLGDGQNITIVDTPGFGDSDQEDAILIDEMMGVLKDTIKTASVLYIVLDGTQERFSDNIQQMLREMRALFGDTMWNNVLIGVNKWKFDQSSIDNRNRTCILTPEDCRDEATFSAVMMEAIEEKFHVGKNLTFAFIDSWAKHLTNIDDQVQQAAFNRESSILWNFAATVQEFAFKSIQDVLDENDALRQENAYLNRVLETNITEILRVLEDFSEDMTDLRIQQDHTSDAVAQLEDLSSDLDQKLVSETSGRLQADEAIAAQITSLQLSDDRLAKSIDSLALVIQTAQTSLESSINQVVVDTANKIKELESRVDASIDSVVGDTANKISVLENRVHSSFVNFAAQGNTDFGGVGFGYDTLVTYNSTLADSHGAMNPSTGYFTAPLPGNYLFLFSGEFFCDDSWTLKGVKSGAIFDIFWCEHSHHFEIGSTVVFVKTLTAGDTVGIKTGPRGGGTNPSYLFGTVTFSGFMLTNF